MNPDLDYFSVGDRRAALLHQWLLQRKSATVEEIKEEAKRLRKELPDPGDDRGAF
jgi:hypothetical protein